MVERAWNWFTQRADTAQVRVWLAVISFTESCVFIVPPDPLMVAMLLVRSDRWLFLGVFTTVFSILGAIFGYVLGAFFFDSVGTHIIATYGLAVYFAQLQETLGNDVFFVTLLAAFTPIPFKVFVLTFGFLKANIVAFLVASIIGRGARYIGLAYATHRIGGRALEYVRDHTASAMVIASLILGAYLARHFLG